MPTSQKKHNLARLRYSRGLKQAQLADLVGCSVPTIKAIEALRLTLSKRLAGKLAETLNVSATWLLENDLATPIPRQMTIEIDLDAIEWL